MKTRIYTEQGLNNELVKKDIKETLKQGRNVIFPTETVYGIGGFALSKDGIEGIYQLKGRPSDNPLIMHLKDSSDLDKYTKNHQPYVQKLMDAFWPGPMTMVFEKTDIVPFFITGGLDTVGIRIPGSDIARRIIDIAGVPICAPSANISGTPSSTTVKHVLHDFSGKVDIIIDGGESEIGLESTVIDVTKEIPVILRPGFITKKMIENITGKVYISSSVKEHDEIPKAPGMKYKHYAPKGNVIIVKGKEEDVITYIQSQLSALKEPSGVLTYSEHHDCFYADKVLSIGRKDNDLEVAHNLFSALREMDEYDIKVIYSFAFDSGEFEEAITNRLYKAANYQIVHV